MLLLNKVKLLKQWKKGPIECEAEKLCQTKSEWGNPHEPNAKF